MCLWIGWACMSLVTQRKRRGVHHRQFNSVVIQPYHQVSPCKTWLTFNVSANSVRFGRNPLFTIPNPALHMQGRCRPDKLLCEISATHRATLFVYNCRFTMIALRRGSRRRYVRTYSFAQPDTCSNIPCCAQQRCSPRLCAQ